MPRTATPIDLAEVDRLRAERKSVGEIAPVFGLTTSAFCKRLRAMNYDLGKRLATNRIDLDQADIETALKSGKSIALVAREKKVSRSVISRHVKQDDEVSILTRALATKRLPFDKGVRIAEASVPIAVGMIAVEFLGNGAAPDKAMIAKARNIHTDRYSVILVRFDDLECLSRHMSEIIDFIDVSFRTPPTARKNWVVRCYVDRLAGVKSKIGRLFGSSEAQRFRFTIEEWF